MSRDRLWLRLPRRIQRRLLAGRPGPGVGHLVGGGHVAAVLAVAGLVADGAAKIRAGERADIVAGEAARAASYASGPDQQSRTAAAAAAARAILSRSGLAGSVAGGRTGSDRGDRAGQRHRPDQRPDLHGVPQRHRATAAWPRNRRPPMNRLPTVARGLGSALLLMLILVGVPVVLVRVGAFPSSVPDPASLWRAATGPDPSGRAVFAVLAALVWLAWATFTLSVLRESAAAIRSRGLRPARSLPGLGWSARPAAALIGAIVTMLVAAPVLTAAAPQAAAAGHHPATAGADRHAPTVATATRHPGPAADQTNPSPADNDPVHAAANQPPAPAVPGSPGVSEDPRARAGPVHRQTPRHPVVDRRPAPGRPAALPRHRRPQPAPRPGLPDPPRPGAHLAHPPASHPNRPA